MSGNFGFRDVFGLLKVTGTFLSTSSLEVLKGAWNNLGQWDVALSMAEGWNELSFEVPSSPNHSMMTGDRAARMFHKSFAGDT